ncbi:MAG: L-alanine exporter AlaE [Rhodobacteraceae bacterium]|nr:L-alanine exporter AlaE [Paracoccaceae bacterium]
MKRFLVDTIATIVFFTVIASLIELAIAGMEPMQVLLTRAVMIPIMALTGRPYGLWRDWIFRRLRPQGRRSTITTELIAFLSFQAPIYIATLALAGASFDEIATATGAAILAMLLISRPFGLFLDAVRRRAGVIPLATLATSPPASSIERTRPCRSQ